MVTGVQNISYTNNNKKLIININSKSTMQYNDILITIDNELILKYLDNLHRIINNWQNEYINYKTIDSNNWQLSITYDNGSQKEYCGNAYPSNFEAFEHLNQELIKGVYNG